MVKAADLFSYRNQTEWQGTLFLVENDYVNESPDKDDISTIFSNVPLKWIKLHRSAQDTLKRESGVAGYITWNAILSLLESFITNLISREYGV